MRFLVDMDNKSEIGYIDWEFIHDMQGIAPDFITPEVIYLTSKFLNQIPEKWSKIKKKLKKNLDPNRTIHCAISDIENFGNEFKIRGIIKSSEGNVLDYHKIVIYDKDKFEDDYIGAVITDKNGQFTLAFGKKVFSDFGLEAEPDIYLKIFRWENERFVEIGIIKPEIFEKSQISDNKTLIEFGVITF